MFDHMVSMEKTPMEREQNSALAAPDEPLYPYGLSLTLNSEELEKLGLDCSDEECQVGNYLHLHALAEVTGYHKSDTGNGEKHTLNIQITHLQIEDEGAENEEADDEMNEGKVYRAAGPY